MLEFASLFLGLIWGSQPIEMVVGDPNIAQLELRLDGRRLAVLEGPPWKATVDLGPLEPHRLEAVGLGRSGEPLARAEQWLNVPRPFAEARLVVEQDAAGRKTHAVLKWESVSGKDPVRREILFDGEALPGSGERFTLPPADPAELHFLSAELIFPDGSTARAEASFGGQFGDRVETELTALPVRMLAADAPLEPLYSCIEDAAGRRLRVAQVERGPAEVLFVRDHGAEALLKRLRFQALSSKLPALRGPSRPKSMRDQKALRHVLTLEGDDRLRFLWPNMIGKEHPHFKQTAYFESSPFYTAQDGGIFYYLNFLYPEKPEGPQHLADALALAGLRAAAEGRRRAAVLVLGRFKPQDASAQTPAAAESFLRSLDVPLHVWSAAAGAKDGPWPPAEPLDDIDTVEKAVAVLRRDLDSQRIVWVAGRHLASELRLVGGLCPQFAPLFPRPAGGPAAGPAQGM